MTIKKFYFQSKNKLAGNLYLPAEINSNTKGALILHGGAKTGKDRFKELQEFLGSHGVVSFAFDFRGIGESDGSLEDGSLNNRLDDAHSALEQLTAIVSIENITIIGCSMGGHVAVRLLGKNKELNSVILLYSAAYGLEAEDKMLNEDFSNVIRKENSWKNSPVFPILEAYKGKVLVIYGENDTVIPKQVMESFRSITEKKGTYILLPHAAHVILSPQNVEQEKDKEYALREISNFLT